MGFTELNKTMSLSYDSLKHLQTVAINGLYSKSYTYKSVNSLRSTNQVSGLSYTANGNTNLSSLSDNYTYDDRGNVTQIKQNGSIIATYGYNDQNQMISETRSGVTYTYTYDTAGNILGVGSGGIYAPRSYTYGFGRWKDLLTSYNGTDIHYEGQNGNTLAKPTSGNPTDWYNGSTFTGLTWVKGRQLSSLTKEGANNSLDVDISYAYDMDGIRKSKRVGTEQHTYLTQSGKVMRETIGSGSSTKILDFVYDNNGLPFALCYSTNNGQTFTDYFFVTNLQGDVVRLVNSAGSTVASYTYDAWGKLLSSSGTMANINPLRYRGYYYDTETGWYYLQSRYYDPTVGRFINADLPEYTAEFSIDDNNLFAYCRNNPVIQEDVNGELGLLASAFVSGCISAAVGAVWGGICSAASGQSFWKGALAGGLSGFVTGFSSTFGPIAGAIGGAIASGVAYQKSSDNPTKLGTMVAVITGAIGGAFGGIWGAKYDSAGHFLTNPDTGFLYGTLNTATDVAECVASNCLFSGPVPAMACMLGTAYTDQKKQSSGSSLRNAGRSGIRAQSRGTSNRRSVQLRMANGNTYRSYAARYRLGRRCSR